MGFGQIFNTLVEFFEGDSWNFTWIDGQAALRLPYNGNSGMWVCFVQAHEQAEQAIFYSVYPEDATPDTIPNIAEFITRANYGMLIGNFEMDYRDGEIRFKTSIDVEGDSLSAALIKNMVYANVIIMDRYFVGIRAVLRGTMTPLEAITAIEGDPSGNADDEDVATN